MRVLFLTHRLPYAPNRGDRARAFHIIRLLAPRVELEVVSLAHDAEEAAQIDLVTQLGARVSVFRASPWMNRVKALPQLGGPRPLTHMLLDAPGLDNALRSVVADRRPDVVLAYCSGMARFALAAPLDGIPLVIDLVDVDSAKWSALAQRSRWPLSWIYARAACATFEQAAALRAQETVVVNEREAALLRAMAPTARVGIVPNGVDLINLRPPAPPTNAPTVVFCGVMDYAPNVEGVLWFARHIWPLIRKTRPDAQFSIVGSNPVDSVRQLHGSESGITVTGAVPDVRPYLWDGGVSIAPLKMARGIQNKVLEALAAGLPSVVTSQVLEGLPADVRPGCSVADTADDFSARTLELLALSGEDRRRRAGQASLSGLSWEEQLAPLLPILDAAYRGDSTRD